MFIRKVKTTNFIQISEIWHTISTLARSAKINLCAVSIVGRSVIFEEHNKNYAYAHNYVLIYARKLKQKFVHVLINEKIFKCGLLPHCHIPPQSPSPSFHNSHTLATWLIRLEMQPRHYFIESGETVGSRPINNDIHCTINCKYSVKDGGDLGEE
jgi:hypothetical protein